MSRGLRVSDLTKLAERMGAQLKITLRLRAQPFNGLSVYLPPGYRRPFSKNELAEHLVGRRPEGVMPIDQPCELGLGYHCPVCKYPLIVDEQYDERLFWSEYQGFLWCAVCNRDYPSCLCAPDAVSGTSIYLMALGEAIERFRANLP